MFKKAAISLYSNIHLNDDRLSWKAKGLLIYLLSKPDDWQVYIKNLVKQSKDGMDSTYAGIKELIKAGYIIKTDIKDEKGIFRGGRVYCY
ncbi:MAG: hypothetical protein GY710_01595 [Desulfobacteraceae bacterium]|nr:hypothetical protein [Desulfobacteraceae bacterium]